MKKLLCLFAVLVSLIGASAQSITVNWGAVPEVAATGYKVYYRVAGSTNSFQTTNVVGRLTTNVIVSVPMYTLYEVYCTSTDTNNFESNPSNKVKAELLYASGFPNASLLTLLENIPSNFTSFLLVDPPNFGTISGTPPSVTFTATNAAFAKDFFAYRSPEIFSGQNVTNYYAFLKVPLNTPPTILSVTPN